MEVSLQQASVWQPMLAASGAQCLQENAVWRGIAAVLLTQCVCLPQQAIAAWPTLMASGLRLGSPALSASEDGTDPNSWIGQFMQQVHPCRHA